MKGLLILFGESFRTGGQDSRIRGRDESYPEQIKAAESHMAFIEDLKNKDCHIDVYISSYTTKFDNDLTKIYANNLIQSDYNVQMTGPHDLLHRPIKNIKNIEIYDFVLFMRIDIYLKDEFKKIFNTKWDKILFPAICFKPWHKVGNHPKVNDMMIYVPKKYFNYIQHIFYRYGGHKLWQHLNDTTDLKYDDLDTMLNTYHDSNTEKDFNPIYYIVNRPQSEVFHTEGEIFDKYNFT